MGSAEFIPLEPALAREPLKSAATPSACALKRTEVRTPLVGAWPLCQVFAHQLSIAHVRVHVRAVDRAVATRRPASALFEIIGMLLPADVDVATPAGGLNLRVAFDAKVLIALNEELSIH